MYAPLTVSLQSEYIHFICNVATGSGSVSYWLMDYITISAEMRLICKCSFRWVRVNYSDITREASYTFILHSKWSFFKLEGSPSRYNTTLGPHNDMWMKISKAFLIQCERYSCNRSPNSLALNTPSCKHFAFIRTTCTKHIINMCPNSHVQDLVNKKILSHFIRPFTIFSPFTLGPN